MDNKKKWNIGLVEDKAKYRSYIKKILKRNSSINDIKTWESAELFWKDESTEKPDLLFIDIILINMNGVELARLINEKNPDLKMVMLTNMTSDELIFKSLQAGAIGYILKSELKDLNNIVRQIMKSGAIITPTIAFRVLSSFQKESRIEGEPGLTQREKQILEFLVMGYSVKDAAKQFHITENTLRTHIKNIYKKLNVKNKVGMMRKASKLRQ